MSDPAQLIARVLDGDADAAAVSELQAWLAADREHLRHYMRAVSLQHGLRSEMLGAAARERYATPTERRMAVPRRRPARRRIAAWAGFALAASLAAVLGGTLWWHQHGADRETWLVVAGSAEGSSQQRIQPGDALNAGDRVSVAAHAQLGLRCRDGTDLRLEGPGQLTVTSPGGDATAGKRLALAGGRLRADVTPQPEGQPLRITTPEAEATVLGTRFALACGDGRTRLEVERGQVRLERLPERSAVVVNAGEYAVAAAGTPLAVSAIVREHTPPSAAATTTTASARTLLAEDFEDDAFAARGWYDNPGFVRASAGHGSAHAAEFRFRRGDAWPTSGGVSRRLFQPATAIRISYGVFFSPGWAEANRASRLTQFRVLTTVDGTWDAPSYTHLTCTIGMDQLVPYLSLQDGQNIDAGRIGQNLVAETEARAVAGGNGDSDGYGPGECFTGPKGAFWNEKLHRVATAALTDHPGPICTGQWHRIEVRFHLNRIVAGKAVPDGLLSYAIDGQTVLERRNVVFRTAQHADMAFNQLVIDPYAVKGAASDQFFRIDDLAVAADPDPSPVQP